MAHLTLSGTKFENIDTGFSSNGLVIWKFACFLIFTSSRFLYSCIGLTSYRSRVCEMALMVTWTTLGSLTAVSECELLLLSTEPFIKVTIGTLMVDTPAFVFYSLKSFSCNAGIVVQ
eukprot:5459503-Amphidinium_carterae.1